MLGVLQNAAVSSCLTKLSSTLCCCIHGSTRHAAAMIAQNSTRFCPTLPCCLKGTSSTHAAATNRQRLMQFLFCLAWLHVGLRCVGHVTAVTTQHNEHSRGCSVQQYLPYNHSVMGGAKIGSIHKALLFVGRECVSIPCVGIQSMLIWPTAMNCV